VPYAAAVRRTLTALACLAALVTTAGPGGASSTAAAVDGEDTPPPTTLLAGHALVAGTDHAQLHNGWYTLDVFPGMAVLSETIPIEGDPGPESSTIDTWSRMDPTGRFDADHDRTQLRLRRNGDLALVTEHGHRQLWHSGTKGSGAARLTLHRGGGLALHTKSGKVVWSSRSGQVQLAGGMSLGPGERLRTAIETGFGGKPYTLTMQRDGNLVQRCGSHVMWQTRTHVRGSSLRLSTGGALRIFSPKGRAVWSSRSGGDGDYAVFDSGRMMVQLDWHVVWGASFDSSRCS
jgi:hypothetical protein